MNVKAISWPLSITVVCVLFFLGMVSFGVFSAFHRVDLVAPDYYDQELRYQERIDSERRAQALGLADLFTYEGESKRLLLTIPNALNATGTVTCYRPSSAELDQHFALALDESGHQTIDARGMKPGPWRVSAAWTVADQSYYVEQLMVLP